MPISRAAAARGLEKPEMTTATSTTAKNADIYAADFAALTGNLNGSSAEWLAPVRKHAIDEFLKIGFPITRRGNELWKYTDLRAIDRGQFRFSSEPASLVSAATLKSRAPWSDDWHTVVLLDGKLSPDLGSISGEPGLSVSSLIEAAKTDSETVKKHLTTLAAVDGNAFVALNTAFMHGGVFIHIAPGAEIAAPVHILNVTTPGASGRALYPRMLLVAEEGSSATVIETHLNLAEGPQFIAPVLEVALGESATLTHYRVQLETEEAFHIATTRVRQSADSNFTSATFATGPAIGRNDVHTGLEAEGAECTLSGLYITNHRSHQDNEISTTHSKPHGTSHQFYKGILAGKSRAVFSGKVVVAPGAMKTVAEQKDLNLLLSRGAEIDTKPSLEIYADDVKCSHGATAGHVDRDMLFYLQSRGIDTETATTMLITGFASEVIDRFRLEPLRDFLYARMDEIIPQLEFEGIL